MTFWSLTNSDFPTNQTFHQFHDLDTELDLHRLWVVSIEHLQRVWLASRERLPFGHLVPSPIVGLANAPIVETRFLELAMSLLDFSPRIPLGSLSIFLFRFMTPSCWDIFLYETEFLQSLLSACRKRFASHLNITYRYIDDALFINNPDLENYLDQMYPGIPWTWDQRHVARLQCARACSFYKCFILRAVGLYSELLGQGYVKERLKSSLKSSWVRTGIFSNNMSPPLTNDTRHFGGWL